MPLQGRATGGDTTAALLGPHPAAGGIMHIEPAELSEGEAAEAAPRGGRGGEPGGEPGGGGGGCSGVGGDGGDRPAGVKLRGKRRWPEGINSQEEYDAHRKAKKAESAQNRKAAKAAELAAELAAETAAQ